MKQSGTLRKKVGLREGKIPPIPRQLLGSGAVGGASPAFLPTTKE